MFRDQKNSNVSHPPSPLTNIKIISCTDKKLQCYLLNTTSAVVNAIRRTIITDVPTMALDIFEFHENTTVAPDETISHRLGMLPLISDNVHFFNTEEECTCDNGCSKCQVKFTLTARNYTDEPLLVTDEQLVRVPNTKDELIPFTPNTNDKLIRVPNTNDELIRVPNTNDELIRVPNTNDELILFEKNIKEKEKQKENDIVASVKPASQRPSRTLHKPSTNNNPNNSTTSTTTNKEVFKHRRVEVEYNDPVLLIKLLKNQEISFTAIATKDTGKKNAKWNSHAVVAYRPIPQVALNQPMLAKLTPAKREMFANSCSTRMFGYDAKKDEVYIENSERCNYCRDCFQMSGKLVRSIEMDAKDPKNALVSVLASANHFMFEIEGVGSLLPEQMLMDGINMLLKRIKNVQKINKKFMES
jgi:DNA-directed RNA polymerase alpha subunit